MANGPPSVAEISLNGAERGRGGGPPRPSRRPGGREVVSSNLTAPTERQDVRWCRTVSRRGSRPRPSKRVGPQEGRDTGRGRNHSSTTPAATSVTPMRSCRCTPCPVRNGTAKRTVSKRFGLNPTRAVPSATATIPSTLPKALSGYPRPRPGSRSSVRYGGFRPTRTKSHAAGPAFGVLHSPSPGEDDGWPARPFHRTRRLREDSVRRT